MALRYIFMSLLLLNQLSTLPLMIVLPELRSSCFEHESYDWDMRATFVCGNGDLYHCLQDANDNQKFYEFCRRFIYILPGTYPVYNPSSDSITVKSCPNNTYQDRLLKSSNLNACVAKTECKGLGSIACHDGSATEDRTCKCDITQGMVILIYGDSPSNTNICCPKIDVSCRCWRKVCSDEEELNEVYQCVRSCKPGFYRPHWTSECIQSGFSHDTKTTTRESTTGVTIASTDAGTTESFVPTVHTGEDKGTMMMPLFITEVSVTVLVVLVVFFICYRKKASSKNRRRKMEIQNNKADINIAGPTEVHIHGDHKGGIYGIKDSNNVAVGPNAAVIVTDSLQADEQQGPTEVHIHDHKGDIYKDSDNVAVGPNTAVTVLSQSDEQTGLITSHQHPSETELKRLSGHSDSTDTEV